MPLLPYLFFFFFSYAAPARHAAMPVLIYATDCLEARLSAIFTLEHICHHSPLLFLIISYLFFCAIYAYAITIIMKRRAILDDADEPPTPRYLIYEQKHQQE